MKFPPPSCYLNLVDGIRREEAHFETTDDATTDVERRDLQTDLDRFRNAGKSVLTVVCADQQVDIDEAYDRSEARGHVPSCTAAELDRTTIAGHAPD